MLQSATRRSTRLVAVGLAAFVAVSHLDAAIGAAPYSGALAAVLGGVAALAGLWGWAVAHRPTRGMLLSGAALFAGLAAIWVCSRVGGLPFGLSPRAPVGVLDSMTAVDEVLLTLAALLLACTPTVESLLPGLGYVAIAISLMVLTAGCNISIASPRQGWLPGASAIQLYCHLY